MARLFKGAHGLLLAPITRVALNWTTASLFMHSANSCQQLLFQCFTGRGGMCVMCTSALCTAAYPGSWSEYVLCPFG